MRLTIHAGHNPDGKVACGAVGLIKESTEARAVVAAMKTLLQNDGHTVYDCTVNNGTSANDVLKKLVANMNSKNVDFNVSIHFNGGVTDPKGDGKSTGVEVLLYDVTGNVLLNQAKKICSEMEALGFKNRGVKSYPKLYIMKHTTKPTMLIEVCFVNDKDDVDIYRKVNVAKAICKGLGCNVDSKKPAQTTQSKHTKIMGKSVLTADKMNAYLKSINPSAPLYADLYLTEGLAEGVRGDLAFCQSILETGYFKFEGSAVTLDQNNFCGMGVTKNGMKGNSFATPRLGIRAQIQHLKAYASTEPLNNPCIDTRFKYVERGCAPYIEWLGIPENPKGKGWAAGANYGTKILTIYNNIKNFKVPESTSANTNASNSRTILIKQTQNWINFYTGSKLKIDGVIGPKTISGLNIALKKYINDNFGTKLSLANDNITLATKAYFRKMVVQTGVDAPYVMIMKMYLLAHGFEVTDLSTKCDAKCVKAIKAKQTAAKTLKVDGIGGYNTWCSLVK